MCGSSCTLWLVTSSWCVASLLCFQQDPKISKGSTVSVTRGSFQLQHLSQPHTPSEHSWSATGCTLPVQLRHWARAASTLEQAGSSHSSSSNPAIVFRVSFLGAEMGQPELWTSALFVLGPPVPAEGIVLLLADTVLSFWICCCELSLACFWYSWPIQ